MRMRIIACFLLVIGCIKLSDSYTASLQDSDGRGFYFDHGMPRFTLLTLPYLKQ